MTCPRSDAVIARFLDGDVGDGHDDAGLAHHANECPTCRLALTRSRQLDAALASACGDGLSEAAAVRVLNGLHAPSRTAAIEPRRAPIALVLAAGFTIGVVTTWLSWPAPAGTNPTAVAARTPAERVTNSEVERSSVASSERVAQPPAWIPIEVEQGPAPRAPAMAWPIRGAESRLAPPSFDSVELMRGAWLQACARQVNLSGFGGPPIDLTAAVDAARVAAGRQQLDAGAPLPELLDVLRREHPAAQALLTHAASHRAFKQRLLAVLNKPQVDPRTLAAVLDVAVRLGDSELDRRIVTRIRRDEQLVERVATACARPAAGVERVTFLLELWGTLSRTGLGDDGDPLLHEVRLAQRWFAPLVAADEVLLATLRQSRNSEIRRRVVLALAARQPTAAVGALLQLLEAPNNDLAQVAAYALCCCDSEVIPRLRQAVRPSRRPDLLWTALLAIGDPAAHTLLPRLNLTSTEAALLAAAPLHPGQVAALAAALRKRPLTLLERP